MQIGFADPDWLEIARAFVGSKEIPGPKHNPWIVAFWKIVGLHFTDDETPWCAGFVGAMLQHAGRPFLKSAWARDYLKYGVKLDKPAYGCIVVFERGSGGHVGFVVGKDKKGNLMVLGGNQSNEVTIAPFATGRVLGYRWPGVWPFPERFNLPLLDSSGRLSTNEA